MSTTKPPGESCAHYSHGVHPLAFVYSVPGKKEEVLPVTGRTGANLCNALMVLNRRRTDLFPDTDRYQYRITNSFAERMWPNQRTKRSQPTKSQVMDAANIERVQAELAGCNVVVLCGARAGWLRDEVQEEGRTIVEMCHTADRALLFRYRKEGEAKGMSLPELWATELCEKLPRRAP